MWDKAYKDYPSWEPLIKQKVYPGKGITGCEMHDINGFGNEYQMPKKKKKGFFSLFRKK